MDATGPSRLVLRRRRSCLKASELIRDLERSLALHGDLVVRVAVEGLEAPVEAIDYARVRADDGGPWRFILVCPPPRAAEGHGAEP